MTSTAASRARLTANPVVAAAIEAEVTRAPEITPEQADLVRRALTRDSGPQPQQDRSAS